MQLHPPRQVGCFQTPPPAVSQNRRQPAGLGSGGTPLTQARRGKVNPSPKPNNLLVCLFVLAILLSLLLVHWSIPLIVSAAKTPSASSSTLPRRGELKADLNTLQHFYHPPQGPHESNHLIDMWEGASLAKYVRHAGLTNNHALIVHAHSQKILSKWRTRQALFPHASRLPADVRRLRFTPGDLAAFLGPQKSAAIRIILLSACNNHGELDLAEWRRHFVNATNIVHMPAGDAAYAPMLMQVLYLDSEKIEPIYETAASPSSGDRAAGYYLGTQPVSRNSLRLDPFVVSSFRPGMSKPFHTAIAGRELFQP